MKSESRVDQILRSALQREPAEREAYLDEVCGDDQVLRRELANLINSLETVVSPQPSETVVSPKPKVEDSAVHFAELLKEDDFVGPYRIKRLLGRGGMGDVYLAEHMGQNRDVALKILPEEFLADAQRIQRFRLEARAVIALNHPNIVTVYDLGVSDSGYFLSTELVEGQTLRARLSQDRITLSQAIDVAEQAASALAYAHEKGVIHRDIKPENIMLRPDGYVKVLDFGLAKLKEPSRRTPDQLQQGSTLTTPDTSPGIVMGTVQYMSPEQARGQAVDERTDVWSLGVVLYEMITGRPAFEAHSTNEIVASILEREPLPLIRFAPDVPLDLERIVMRALRKEPGERYQVIRDLLLDLRTLKQEIDLARKLERHALRNPSTEITVTPTPYTTHASNPRVSRSLNGAKSQSRIVSIVLIVGLLAVLVAFYFLLLKKPVSRSSAFSSISIGRLTTTGKSRLAAISPDGKYVVHVVSDGGKQGLWIRQVTTTNNVQIIAPAEIDYQGLTFSPDGNYVFYTAHEKGQPIRDLYQVPALGGAARKLIRNVDTAVSFSPDGKRLTFVRRFSDRAEDSLIIANADGSNEQTLVTRKQPDFFSMSGPAWSADGKTIACGAGSSDQGGRFMTVIGIDAEKGNATSLSKQRWFGVGRVAWRGKENDLLVNAVEQTLGSYQIWLVSSLDGSARRITNDLSDYRDLSVTADASLVAVTQLDQSASLWVLDFNRPDSARQITSGKYDGFYGVDWMPDNLIVFSSSAGGNHNIWQIDTEGSNQKQFTSDTRSNVWPSVSPDGRYVVFSSDRTGVLHLWRMNRDGSNLLQLTNSGGEDWPAFTPDGRSVVYTVIGGPDRFTIWKVPIEGGEPVRLTDRLALQAAVSPDGKLIALSYRADAQALWKLVLIPIDGGLATQTFEIPQSVELPIVLRWQPDGRALTYVDGTNGMSNLWSQPITGGPATKLSNWSSQQIFAFAWSRDGKHLAVSRGSRNDDIVLIKDAK